MNEAVKLGFLAGHETPSAMIREVRIVATMPVRNEDWCLGASLRTVLAWCDEVIVYLHACTDASQAISVAAASEHPGRVVIVEQPDPKWDEMDHRQSMIQHARDAGATHIAIIDADEILTANLLPTIRNVVAAMPRNAILQLPGYNLRHGLWQYHSNGVWGNRWFSVAFVDSPSLGWFGDRFHSREPGPAKLTPYRPIPQGTGGVMHLWGASERRLVAKHALYQLIERQRWPDKPVEEIRNMYTLWRDGWPGDAPMTFSDVPEDWWPPLSACAEFSVDAEPWQEAEVRRILRENPQIADGLDMFGLSD